MSIYEQITAVRDEVMNEERNTILKFEKLNVLSNVLSKAFKNFDKIPEQFELDEIEWSTEMLKLFLEQIPDVKIRNIEKKVLTKSMKVVYKIKLI